MRPKQRVRSLSRSRTFQVLGSDVPPNNQVLGSEVLPTKHAKPSSERQAAGRPAVSKTRLKENRHLVDEVSGRCPINTPSGRQISAVRKTISFSDLMDAMSGKPMPTHPHTLPCGALSIRANQPISDASPASWPPVPGHYAIDSPRNSCRKSGRVKRWQSAMDFPQVRYEARWLII
jgi:hypothetical protein